MKLRKLIYFISGFGILMLVNAVVSSAVFAVNGPNSEPGQTKIEGKITDFNGNPVANAEVYIVCHHDGNDYYNTRQIKSSALGNYTYVFQRSECDTGDIVDVTAQKDGMSGSGSGEVKLEKEVGAARINIAIVNVSIPEFGVLAGITTILASGISFLIIRKRSLVTNRKVF